MQEPYFEGRLAHWRVTLLSMEEKRICSVSDMRKAAPKGGFCACFDRGEEDIFVCCFAKNLHFGQR